MEPEPSNQPQGEGSGNLTNEEVIKLLEEAARWRLAQPEEERATRAVALQRFGIGHIHHTRLSRVEDRVSHGKSVIGKSGRETYDAKINWSTLIQKMTDRAMSGAAMKYPEVEAEVKELLGVETIHSQTLNKMLRDHNLRVLVASKRNNFREIALKCYFNALSHASTLAALLNIPLPDIPSSYWEEHPSPLSDEGFLREAVLDGIQQANDDNQLSSSAAATGAAAAGVESSDDHDHDDDAPQPPTNSSRNPTSLPSNTNRVATVLEKTLALKRFLEQDHHHGDILPELIFNIDSTSFLLKHNYVEKAVVPDGVVKHHRNSRLSITVSAKDMEDKSQGAQDRSVHMHALTTASGELACVVVEIADRVFIDVQCFQVDVGKKNYNMFIVTRPAKEPKRGPKQKKGGGKGKSKSKSYGLDDHKGEGEGKQSATHDDAYGDEGEEGAEDDDDPLFVFMDEYGDEQELNISITPLAGQDSDLLWNFDYISGVFNNDHQQEAAHFEGDFSAIFAGDDERFSSSRVDSERIPLHPRNEPMPPAEPNLRLSVDTDDKVANIIFAKCIYPAIRSRQELVKSRKLTGNEYVVKVPVDDVLSQLMSQQSVLSLQQHPYPGADEYAVPSSSQPNNSGGGVAAGTAPDSVEELNRDIVGEDNNLGYMEGVPPSSPQILSNQVQPGDSSRHTSATSLLGGMGRVASGFMMMLPPRRPDSQLPGNVSSFFRAPFGATVDPMPVSSHYSREAFNNRRSPLNSSMEVEEEDSHDRELQEMLSEVISPLHSPPGKARRISGNSIIDLSVSHEPLRPPSSLLSSHQSHESAFVQSSSAHLEEESSPKALLMIDGEVHFLNACINQCPQYIPFNIKNYKFPSSCSPIFQPNDVAPSFMNMKTVIRGKTFKKMLFGGIKPAYIPDVDKLLSSLHIQASSKKTFLNFFTFLPDLLELAYTRRKVSDGYQGAGIYPFCLATIFERYHAFNQLPESHKLRIVAAVPVLAKIIKEQGYVPDDQMVKYTGLVYQGLPENRRDYKSCPLNYMRGVIICHPLSLEYDQKYKASKKRMRSSQDGQQLGAIGENEAFGRNDGDSALADAAGLNTLVVPTTMQELIDRHPPPRSGRQRRNVPCSNKFTCTNIIDRDEDPPTFWHCAKCKTTFFALCRLYCQ